MEKQEIRATYDERRFDTDIEGLAQLNEEYRTYIEDGYDLRALELDDERLELILEFQVAWDEYQTKKAALFAFLERKDNGELNYSDYVDLHGEKSNEELGALEFRKDLEKARKNLTYVAGRLRSINSYLDSILHPKTEEVHIEEDVSCAICSAKMPDMHKWCQAEKKMRREAYEQRKLHYQYVHDACVRREDRLTRLLRRSTEEQDRHALKVLNRLKAERQVTGPWYYKLSMLVVLKHVRRELYPEFSMASNADKRKMRKSGEWFWEAAFDRLRNFRRVNEKVAANNDREWKLPHNDFSLEPMEVEYDEKDKQTTGSVSTSEDAMIATIDAKSSWFLERVKYRARKMREDRKPEENSKMRRERINNIAKNGEEV